jgi:hypothetical protein
MFTFGAAAKKTLISFLKIRVTSTFFAIASIYIFLRVRAMHNIGINMALIRFFANGMH